MQFGACTVTLHWVLDDGWGDTIWVGWAVVGVGRGEVSRGGVANVGGFVAPKQSPKMLENLVTFGSKI